jgi:hypothetical protein
VLPNKHARHCCCILSHNCLHRVATHLTTRLSVMCMIVIMQLTPGGLVEVTEFDTRDGIYDCAWSEVRTVMSNVMCLCLFMGRGVWGPALMYSSSLSRTFVEDEMSAKDPLADPLRLTPQQVREGMRRGRHPTAGVLADDLTAH